MAAFGPSRKPHWIQVGRGRSHAGEATGREGNERFQARPLALYPRSAARRINSAGVTIAIPKGLPKARRSRSDATTNSALAANAHARNGSSLGSRLRRFPRGAGTQCNALWCIQARKGNGERSGNRVRWNSRQVPRYSASISVVTHGRKRRRATRVQARRAVLRGQKIAATSVLVSKTTGIMRADAFAPSYRFPLDPRGPARQPRLDVGPIPERW